MKKLINLVALVMLVSTNVLTPFSYAQVETSEVISENEVENVVEVREISEINEEAPELVPEGKGELEQERYVDEISEDENMDENLELEQLQESVVMETISGNSAILLSGQQFNDEIRSFTTGQIEKMIQWTGDVPLGVDTKVVSAPYSDNIVEMWFDEGIIYYHTNADKIYFNSDSRSMFSYMSISELDLRNFDVSRVIDMSDMFSMLWGTILNVDGWDTSNVKYMDRIFYYNVPSVIYSSNDWNLENLEHGGMYTDGCIRGGLGSEFYVGTGGFKVDNLQQSGMFTSDIIAVSFRDSDGSEIGRQIIKIGETPEVFTPQGGCAFSGDNSYINQKLYKYTEINFPIVCTVTFETNGGTEINPISGPWPYNPSNYPPYPSRDGSKFMGWYSDKEFSDFRDGRRFFGKRGGKIKENMTFYAKWDGPWYVFDAKGGYFEDGDDKNIIKYRSNAKYYNRGCYNDYGGMEMIDTSCLNVPNFRDVIKIEGATHLHVIFKGLGYYAGTLYVFTGEREGDSDTGYLYKLYSTSMSTEFDVEGDTLTFIGKGYTNWGGASYFAVIYSGERYIMDYIVDGEVKTPTREGYEFVGWVDEETDEDFDPNAPVTGDKKFYAKWKCAQGYVDKQGQCVKEETKPSGGSSGGGGGGGGGATKPDTPKEEQKPADTSEQISQNDNSVSSGANVKIPENETQMDSQPSEQSSVEQPEGQGNGRSNTSDNSYTNEQKEAYEFSKENGITTMATIQKADMSGKLTRIQMAKMLSQYAINVLGQTPDTSKTIKFVDVTDKRDADYDNGVTLAYQLGIMGQNMKDNKFRPNDEVSRAEFVTALSRLLYSTSDGEYKSTSKYYIHHMEKLVKEGIITNDDPKMKERRGYVMIMLMRSAK